MSNLGHLGLEWERKREERRKLIGKDDILRGAASTGKFIQSLVPTTPEEMGQELVDMYSSARIAKGNPWGIAAVHTGKKLIQNSPEVAKAVKVATDVASPYIKKGKEFLEKDWFENLPGYQGRQLATAGGPDSLNIPKTVEPVIDGSKPFQMTADEAATTWGKVTKAPIAELGITSAQKGADHGSMSRIVRYVESGRFNKLDHRNKKTIISSQIENSPIEYLVKYHGGDLLDAESHHILDIDFWGRALDTKNNKAVSTVLWKDGVHTGNAKKNIVWAWAARKGSMDHNTLHALYNQIPSRKGIETLMANGSWYTMKADAQAKLLREVAYDQHRITNNFMNMKLNFILKEHPELALLHPEHLKNKIVKNPKKYGEIAVINPKDPNEVQQLLMTLTEAPYTGRVHPKVREVFGLETPKATAKKYSGSISQKEFNKRLSHRLNKALKINK